MKRDIKIKLVMRGTCKAGLFPHVTWGEGARGGETYLLDNTSEVVEDGDTILSAHLTQVSDGFRQRVGNHLSGCQKTRDEVEGTRLNGTGREPTWFNNLNHETDVR